MGRRTAAAIGAFSFLLVASLWVGCGKAGESRGRTLLPGAQSPGLVKRDHLVNLLLDDRDLPAGAVLSTLSTDPQSPSSVREFWHDPPKKPGGRSSWGISFTIAIADSPEAASALLKQWNRSVAASLWPVRGDAELASLGEEALQPPRPHQDGAVWFRRGNVAVQVQVYPDDRARLLGIAGKLSRRIAAAQAGKPEPPVLPPLSADENLHMDLARAGKEYEAYRLWGDDTERIGVAFGDGLPRAVPAKRLEDGDYLVPLGSFAAALNSRVRTESITGDPGGVRASLYGRTMRLRKGDARVEMCYWTVTLRHPVEFVEGRLVVPLSFAEDAMRYRMRRETKDGVVIARFDRAAPVTEGGEQPGCLPKAEAFGTDVPRGGLGITARAYAYCTWSSKGGSVKPGINIGEALRQRFPTLKAGAPHPPMSFGEGWPQGVTHVEWHTGDRKRNVSIRMWVTESCDDAQQFLLRRVTFVTSPLRRSLGQEMGIELGDASFPGEKSTTFVRSNLVFEVNDPGEQAIELAQMLDKAVLAEKEAWSFDELDAYRPRVRNCRLAPGVREPLTVGGRIGETTEFPLKVDVVDPRGGKLWLFWEGKGNVNAGKSTECRESKYSLSVSIMPPVGETVTRTITITAVNERGMYTREGRSFDVRVTEAKSSDE